MSTKATFGEGASRGMIQNILQKKAAGTLKCNFPVETGSARWMPDKLLEEWREQEVHGQGQKTGPAMVLKAIFWSMPCQSKGQPHQAGTWVDTGTSQQPN